MLPAAPYLAPDPRPRNGSPQGGNTRKDKATVPLWHVQALQMVMLTPYVFSALAKLRVAWLVHAEPLRSNLRHHGHTDIAASPLPLCVAWTSLILDLLVRAPLAAPCAWRTRRALRISVHMGACLPLDPT